MGAAVREVASERGHEIMGVHDLERPLPDRVDADVIIDFSHASAMARVFEVVCASRSSLITGTTGWSDRESDFRDAVARAGICCVAASNFSVGANVLFELASAAGRAFAGVDGYETGIEERHHSRKVDAPSGTALTLAERVREGSSGDYDPSIVSSRVGQEFGLHTLFFDSADDLVELSHRARGRTGFARGAVIAAERSVGRSGWLTFRELLFGGGNV